MAQMEGKKGDANERLSLAVAITSGRLLLSGMASSVVSVYV